MKRTRSTVSLLLILSMLLSVLPGTAAAEINEITTEPITEALPVSEETAVTETTPDSEITIIHEDVSLRGEYEKHFLMSDGSYQAVVYNEPVHYETAAGWAEIDNTLSLQTAADGTARYATANGLTNVDFAQNFGDELVTMQQGEYSLAWGVQAVPGNSGAITSNALAQLIQADLVTADLSALTVEEQKTLAAKSSSTIQYRNALWQDVDLEYIVLPSRVKENIILQSPQDISGYVVTVYAENITARLLDNRSIEFYNDSDEVIFTMTSPYMYDSAGELSEDITVEMIQKGKGIYFICMTPDAQWLNDESRVYPVVIDPQVSTSNVQQNIIDNYVLQGSGVQNNNLDRLYIGNKSGSRARAFIQFATMPTIASGNIILSAEMTVQLLAGTSTAQNIGAYIVTEADWSSGTITWDNQPDATIVLHPIIGHNNLTNYNFTCLEAVERWYTGMPNGQYQNYGIMLRYSNESIADYNSVYSADCTDAAKRPVMTINYQSSLEEISIREGSTYTLTVSTSSTVTWTSSNTAVATVSSSGKITGVGSGDATITGTVNGSTVHTCTVHVKLRDGVYRMKNGASNVYIGTTGGISDGTTTSLRSESTSHPEQLYQLWKITYLDNGYYCIRPLYKLDMALGLNGANVSVYTIGTTDSYSAVPSANYWTITADTLGYAIKRGGSNGLAMAPSNDTPASGTAVVVTPYSSTNTARHWSLEKVSSPPTGALLYDTATQAIVSNPSKYMSVGETKSLSDFNLCTTAYSADTNSQDFYWYSSNTAVATVNSSTGAVTGVSAGTAIITGTPTQDSSNHYVSYTIYVSKLLIYQTRKTYYHDAEGNYAEDLECGDMSEDDLRALDWVSWTDFAGYTPTLHRADWEYMCTTLFSEGELETVILDMIDHFMEGSGSEYSNSVLTQHAHEHDSTQEYIENVEEQVGLLLNTYDGDICALSYTASNRGSNPLVNALAENDIMEPVYDSASDKINGLTICVDSLWGNKIEVSSYSINGSTYSCTLHYTLYDHFGLNQPDVEKYGLAAGFRSWYILQHYDEYNEAYKPFLTLMEFDVTISGTIS